MEYDVWFKQFRYFLREIFETYGNYPLWVEQWETIRLDPDFYDYREDFESGIDAKTSAEIFYDFFHFIDEDIFV